jgi:choline kinase
MRMVETDYLGVEIDTPADLERAERLLAERARGAGDARGPAAGAHGARRT